VAVAAVPAVQRWQAAAQHEEHDAHQPRRPAPSASQAAGATLRHALLPRPVALPIDHWAGEEWLVSRSCLLGVLFADCTDYLSRDLQRTEISGLHCTYTP